MQVSIIVPTYEEAENLGVLVPRVVEELERAGLDGEIIVVDDNSPDDTVRVCEELAKRFRLRLLVRENERGLSSAVLHGMKAAEGAILLVMDADLSHPPEKVPELVATLDDESVDFVIGSRYVPGGSTEEGWGFLRWLNSKIATWLARPLTKCSDPMAGFFALRRDRFAAAAKLDPIGYKIGLELIVKCGCREVREVPIAFHNRLHGESKLSLSEQINYLRHLRRLYEHKLGRIARPLQFALVGATGTMVDLMCFTALAMLWPFPAARALAIGIAMSWNFGLNRAMTFSYARSGPILRQYVLFCLSCTLGAIGNWGVSVGLHSNVPFFEQNEILAVMCGVFAGVGFNYFLSSRVVFRRKDRKLQDDS
jgi:dolichol-phosphate mannosyltransferase